MKKHNLALVILMALGVVACGGGGSKGSSSHNRTQTNTERTTTLVPSVIQGETVTITTNSDRAAPPQPPVANPNNGTTQPIPPNSATPSNIAHNNIYADSSKTITGSGFSILKEKGAIDSIRITSDSPIAFNQLDVNGTIIEILPKSAIFDDKQPIYYQKDDKGTRLVGTSEKYIRWGFIDEASVPHKYVIATGIHATKEMPTANNVSYQGHAMHLYTEAGKKNISTLSESKADFVVNFGEKTLSGTISPLEGTNSNFTPVKLSAQIEKNYFKGELDGITLQGGFFGPQAAEMTGSYLREAGSNPVLGVFGAKKQ